MKMNEEQCKKFSESGAWKELSYKERALLVFANDGVLCMPFDEFHKAIENALDRPVWTHEFGLNWNELEQELLGLKPKPSLQEIMNLIPEEKRIILEL